MLELLSLSALVILGLAWLLSIDRRAIRWRPVLVGTALQFGFAPSSCGRRRGEFFVLGDIVRAFLDFTDAGAIRLRRAVLISTSPSRCPIIFFSSFIPFSIGVLQWVVKLFARVMVRFMGTSGSESLASANIFVGGQAPLLIKRIDSLEGS